ncbi:P-loop containing nucleoside triphosphate hydrolase protein [Morchella snyderi]|nr:P-loop containing nucleoside triphosphate hydrolase protein [Morchella snyderi]
MASPTSQVPVLRTRNIWYIIGPGGCGKSTIGSFLSAKLNLPYTEGDGFHPPANIKKMSAGIPLTGDDRWGWLSALRAAAAAAAAAGGGAVVACSCLKKRYRDVMRGVGEGEGEGVQVRFVYLCLAYELVVERVGGRKGHFFGAALVESQFEALEEPGEEEGDVVVVDAAGRRELVEEDAWLQVSRVM